MVAALQYLLILEDLTDIHKEVLQGGLTQKTVYLAINSTLSFTIGSGGNEGAGNNGAFSGSPGGNTTVTGSGLSLTANGGVGGVAIYDTTTVLPALTGGTASGGDFSTTGGGAIARPSASTSGGQGGAAVGILTSVGYPATSYTGSGANGGSGIGGIPTYAGSWPYGGGGSFGNGVGYSGGPGLSLVLNTTGAGTNYAVLGSSFFASLNGQGGYTSNAGSLGGGGGASTSGTGGVGGMCAGGGSGNHSSNIATGGAGGLGGGGGGAGYTRTSSGYLTTNGGKGGNGLVVIEYLGE